MTLNEYQAMAMRTSPDGHDRIKNGLMWLIGETGELVDVMKKYLFQSGDAPELPKTALINECGDVMWYCAEVATGLSAGLADIAFYMYGKTEEEKLSEYSLEESAVNLSLLAGAAFNSMYQLADARRLICVLRDIVAFVTHIATILDATVEHIMESNIRKLQARYPDGFDPERSMNRAT